MARPQLENGYIKIANEIYDAFIGSRVTIPAEVRRVVDFIIRKTYGWGKCEDCISLSQFALATGLKKQSVCRAINKGIKMNLISRTANRIAWKYRFNKDFTGWRSLAPRLIVSPTAYASLAPRLTTKETTTKERVSDSLSAKHTMRLEDSRKFSIDEEPIISLEGDSIYNPKEKELMAKKNKIGEINKIMSEYERLFVKLNNDKDKIPKMNINGLRKIIGRALKNYSVEEIISYMPEYLKADWPKDSGWALWTMLSEKTLNRFKHEK